MSNPRSLRYHTLRVPAWRAKALPASVVKQPAYAGLSGRHVMKAIEVLTHRGPVRSEDRRARARALRQSVGAL